MGDDLTRVPGQYQEAGLLVLAIVAAGAVLVTFVFTTTGGKHSRPSRRRRM